jgi:hypothetical protein
VVSGHRIDIDILLLQPTYTCWKPQAFIHDSCWRVNLGLLLLESSVVVFLLDDQGEIVPFTLA